MAAAKGNAPVVIKRKKVVAEAGHHGGAWKVAYADFVTAMMAFFLLMWLLNATTEKQRKGLADHFSPSIPINRTSGGGDDALGGDSIFAQETLARSGIGATTPRAEERPPDIRAAEEDAALAELEAMLVGRGAEALLTENELRHIVTRITDAGLVVEIFSLPDATLFEPQSDAPTDLLETLLDVVGRLFALAENRVAIDGYSRARPIVLVDNPVWDWSISRAERARDALEGHIAAARIHRATGHADRRQAVAPPMAVRNDRLELTLLRPDAE